MSRIQHTYLISIGLQNSIVGHLDMVNYFFPIRLNILIVMGLGPAGGLAFLGGPEPDFWRRAGGPSLSRLGARHLEMDQII